jgi:hypothetical protein
MQNSKIFSIYKVWYYSTKNANPYSNLINAQWKRYVRVYSTSPEAAKKYVIRYRDDILQLAETEVERENPTIDKWGNFV